MGSGEPQAVQRLVASGRNRLAYLDYLDSLARGVGAGLKGLAEGGARCLVTWPRCLAMAFKKRENSARPRSGQRRAFRLDPRSAGSGSGVLRASGRLETGRTAALGSAVVSCQGG